ncbi:MAG: phosphatase PAP2 family protein [Ruthenibacterium sp.]
MKQKTNTAWLIGGLFLFSIGMTAGFLWDLPLDIAVHNATWLPAILMESFGFYLQYLPPIFLFFCFAKTKTVPLWARILLGVIATLGGAALIVYSGTRLFKRETPAAGLILIVFALLFALCCFVLIRALRQTAFLQKATFICAWGTVYLLVSTLVINVLKLIWNRTRFDDMLALGDFSHFTAWIHPFGMGGSSFPSGHVAAACSIFILILCCDVFPFFAKHRTMFWSISWAYIAWMALCRIVIGRHYLSDTVMAAFVMTVLFFAMTRNVIYRNSLNTLRNQTQVQ